MDHVLNKLFNYLAWVSLILSVANASTASYDFLSVQPLINTNSFAGPADPTSTSMEGLRTFFYNQTIDHFSYRPESYATFLQRYFVKDKYWGGATNGSPIFVYLGEHQETEQEIPRLGFLEENAPQFNALIVYIEHRFYGLSNPNGSMEESLADRDIRGYLDSAQALADFAEIILFLKKELAAENCPVIVIGASYGGMLAAWFRLKYPHVALGALASSAPLLSNANSVDKYVQLITKDYRDTSPNCYATIKQSWTEMDTVGSQADGLNTLMRQFNICSNSTLMSLLRLKRFLTTALSVAAQYDAPPLFPVSQICRAIDGAPIGANVLEKLSAGVATFLRISYPNNTCFTGTEPFVANNETLQGWGWQTCTELLYFRYSVSSNDTISMFPWIPPFDLNATSERCSFLYGVEPRPNWIQTYYGGQDIKLVLKRFGSNIIFSNGLRDPYSGTGVLENLSDTLIAVFTTQGSHCLDLLKSDNNDPQWLVDMRREEASIIKGWLEQYYADLQAST